MPSIGKRSRRRTLTHCVGVLSLGSFDQHGRLPLFGVTIHAVISFDVSRIGDVARLALLIVRLAIGLCLGHPRRYDGRTGTECADTASAQKAATADGCLVVVLHRTSSLWPFDCRLIGERARLSFTFQKEPAKRADRSIEIRSLRIFHVGEQTAHPWCDMFLEHLMLCVR